MAASTLFDIFSINLAFYRKEYSGRFMCPLCLRKFSRNQMSSELDKAHIIPRFLGGRYLTLACKECNSKIGTEIECYEAERVNFNRALSGEGNETTRVELHCINEQGDIIGPVQADMRAINSNGNRRLQLGKKKQGSNPEAVEFLNSITSSRTPPDQCKIEVEFCETRNCKRANLIYLHMAYMFMFHQFGYEWALNPCADPIRKQIMSPDESIIQPMDPNLYNIQVLDDEISIFLVTKPLDFRSFLVVLPLLRGWTKRHAMWMPLFGCPYKQPSECKGVNLSVIRVPGHHQYLNQQISLMQGFKFVLSHFDYEPILYAEHNWFEDYG